MPGVQRDGDANTAGGVVSGGSTSVRINGRPVTLAGNSVSPHPCCGQRRCPPIHCYATTTGGAGSVRVGGINIILTGDVDTCGHPRAGGSTNVRIS